MIDHRHVQPHPGARDEAVRRRPAHHAAGIARTKPAPGIGSAR